MKNVEGLAEVDIKPEDMVMYKVTLSQSHHWSHGVAAALSITTTLQQLIKWTDPFSSNHVIVWIVEKHNLSETGVCVLFNLYDYDMNKYVDKAVNKATLFQFSSCSTLCWEASH